MSFTIRFPKFTFLYSSIPFFTDRRKDSSNGRVAPLLIMCKENTQKNRMTRRRTKNVGTYAKNALYTGIIYSSH